MSGLVGNSRRHVLSCCGSYKNNQIISLQAIKMLTAGQLQLLHLQRINQNAAVVFSAGCAVSLVFLSILQTIVIMIKL